MHKIILLYVFLLLIACMSAVYHFIFLEPFLLKGSSIKLLSFSWAKLVSLFYLVQCTGFIEWTTFIFVDICILRGRPVYQEGKISYLI